MGRTARIGIYQVVEIKSSKIYAACSADLAAADCPTGLQKNTQTIFPTG
jgi:hypothetical protein